jgi:branched-chain amino acid transport system substrate-binding protein
MAVFTGLPVRLVPRWSVDPWGTGVSQLARMVYEDQPLALLGSVDSATTHLAEQVVAKAQLPLVSPVATDKSVTLAGVSWMFSCAPSDAVIARVLVDDLLGLASPGQAKPLTPAPGPRAPTEADDQGERAQSTGLAPSDRSGIALVTCTDHASRMMTREVLREFSRRGRLPDLRLEVPPGAAEVSRQLERLAESKPGVVLVVAGAEDAARLVRAVRAPGLRIWGTHAMGRTRFRELAGPAAEGVRFPVLFTADPGDLRYGRFANRFQAERNRAPDCAAVLTYDATRLLLEAIRRAGPNRTRIRDALTQLSPWPGLAGLIQFDGTGQNTRTNICLGTIRNGAVTPLSAINPSTQTGRNEPPP